MEAMFLKLLNMSITAGWLVLAVIVLRLLLKKAPKAISCLLWALVAIRLICPFSIESVLSLIPSAETVPQNITYSEAPVINSGLSFLNSTVNPIISKSLAPELGASANPMEIIIHIASVIWLAGAVGMALYAVISYLRLRKKTNESVMLNNNVWLCDRISTPFILGVLHPRIFLPSDLNEEDMGYVVAHENAHLKRHDNLWKPLGFILLCVYWFNPVMWIAYILLCRDIELACDERVIRDMGSDAKKPYSAALINCSIPRKMISACPLAFGEVSVKIRIKSVLNYKKPALWIIITAVIASAAVVVGFMTNPHTSQTDVDKKLNSYISQVILEENRTDHTADNLACESHKILKAETKGNRTVVYAWVLYMEYANADLETSSGSHIPTVITVDKNEGQYDLAEYWVPRDGSYYEPDIKSKFPSDIQDKALDSQLYIEEQTNECASAAKKYFGILDESSQITISASADENTILLKYYKSADPMLPTVTLSKSDGTFQFIYSGLSSYIAMGTYEMTETELILTTDDSMTGDDQKNIYVFRKKGDSFVFDADRSSEIPKLSYAAGEEPVSPVPDGAVFEQVGA